MPNWKDYMINLYQYGETKKMSMRNFIWWVDGEDENDKTITMSIKCWNKLAERYRINYDDVEEESDDEDDSEDEEESEEDKSEIVFCCKGCDTPIIRNSREHDECKVDWDNDDDWYCADCDIPIKKTDEVKSS